MNYNKALDNELKGSDEIPNRHCYWYQQKNLNYQMILIKQGEYLYIIVCGILHDIKNSIALDEELKTSIHHASQDGKTKASLSYYKEEEKIICNVEIEVNQLHQNQHQMIQFIKFDCLQFFIKEQLGL